MTQYNISKDSWNDFIVMLTKIKDVCNDIHIVGSMIRQRTNNHTSVIEIDLKDIFESDDVEFALPNIQRQLYLLKTIDKKSDVRFDIIPFIDEDITDEDITKRLLFTDNLQTIEVNNAEIDFIENKFLDQSELDSIFPADDSSIMFDYIITPKIAKLLVGFERQTVTEVYSLHYSAEDIFIEMKDRIDGRMLRPKININVVNVKYDKFISHISNITSWLIDKKPFNATIYNDLNQPVALVRADTIFGNNLNVSIYNRTMIAVLKSVH